MNKEGRVIIVIPIFLTIIFLFTPVFAYDTHVAHPKLSEQAVDVFNMHFGNKISEANKKFISIGAINEDTPIRWMNYFFEPNQNMGLLGFQTAKNWSQNSKVQALYAKGDQSWSTAVSAFADNDNEKAFTALGHFLHLIEDMTVPAHTRLDIHVFNGGDPYEQWVKNNYKMEKFIAPSTPKSLDSAFDYLAFFSNKNFFSKDTIEITSEKYFERKNNQNRYITCLEGSVDNNKFCLLKCDISIFDDKHCYIEDTVNADYFSLLAPKAISYGAGVIKLFFDEAEALKEKREAEKKKLFDSFLDFTKNIFFTIAFAKTNDPTQFLRQNLTEQTGQTANQKTAPTSTPKIVSTETTTPAIAPSQPRTPIEQWPEFLPDIFVITESAPTTPSTESVQQPSQYASFIPFVEFIPSSGGSTFQKSPVIIPPNPPSAPTLNSIFSSLVYASSSPTDIFGECSSSTTQITMYRALERATSTDGLELIQTFNATSSAWQTESSLQYGNNLYYFTAQNISNQTSELSEPANIIFDNKPPEVAFASIVSTSTEESSQIELNFSAFDDFSENNCFDLQVSVNTSSMSEVLNCANFGQYVFETEESGEIQFYLRAKDELGNYSEWVATSTIIAPIGFEYNYLNGKQTESELILTKEGSPYILQNYTVPVGKILRVEPGVVVKGLTRRSVIYVEGKIFAEGTEEEPIYFTSVQDRSFGSNKLNTPDLGLARGPKAQDWSAISFYRALGIFDNVVFRYGGTDHIYPCIAAVMTCDSNMEVLFFSNSTITLKRTLIEKTGPGIMSSSRTSITIIDSTIDGLADGAKADYAIRSVRGTIHLDNVIFKNLKLGISASNNPPIITHANMSLDNFIDVDNPWLPESIITL